MAGSSAIRGTFFDLTDDPWKHSGHEAAKRNMRMIAGLNGMDRFCPAENGNSPEEFYRESSCLIERYHRKGRNLYAITPRFAVGCTDEMMETCRRLKKEHPDCWIN